MEAQVEAQAAAEDMARMQVDARSHTDVPIRSDRDTLGDSYLPCSLTLNNSHDHCDEEACCVGRRLARAESECLEAQKNFRKRVDVTRFTPALKRVSWPALRHYHLPILYLMSFTVLPK